MNCVAYLFFTTLVANIFCFTDNYYNILDEPITRTTYPYNLVYQQNKDFLSMGITVKLNPSVTAVHVKYQTDKTPMEVKINTNKKTKEVKLMISKSLKYNHMYVDVELQNRTGVCYTTKVAEGWAKSDLAMVYDSYGVYYTDNAGIAISDTGDCLAPKACVMVVDLKNHCKEEASCAYYSDCKAGGSQFNCTMFNAPKGFYKWYQNYDSEHSIGDIPMIYYTNTKIQLDFKVELFDNNSFVNLTTSANGKNICATKLTVKENFNYMEDYNVATLNYSEATDNIPFSCDEYVNQENKNNINIHVGFINTTNNTIKTFNGTTIQGNKFNMADNGTILCCLFYNKEYVGQEWHIKRLVEKKTLLIYQPTSIANLTVSETNEQTTSDFQNNWLIYVLATSGIAILILILLILIFRNRWCKHSVAEEETVGLDNYAPQNQVLYAELNLMDNVHPPPRQNEESHYANIVGVVHPL